MPLLQSQIFINTRISWFDTQKINNDRLARRYFFQILWQELLHISTVEIIMSESHWVMGTFSVAPNESKGAFEDVKSSENDQWKTSKRIIFQKINNAVFVGNPLKAPFDLLSATENFPMIQWLKAKSGTARGWRQDNCTSHEKNENA